MNKIVCDVCGTSYPESATRCPICGCVRSPDAIVITDSTGVDSPMPERNYTYVKGGRFSKTNVRKRNASSGLSTVSPPPKGNNSPAKSGNDRGLIVAVILLLLAIIAVVIYIVVRYFGPLQDQAYVKPDQGIVDTQDDDKKDETQDDEQGNDDVPVEIPCVSVTASSASIEFSEAGQTAQLSVTLEPKDTTDTVKYIADDPSVATVTENGLITSVADGETIVRIKCGNAEYLCNVICTFSTDLPDDSDTQTPEPTLTFTLNRTDFTLGYIGETWNLYSGTVPVEDIVWRSNDEVVATVTNGVVLSVGKGRAIITAEYNGTVLECIVHCS